MNRFSLYLLLVLSFFLTEFSYGQDEELSLVSLLGGSQVLVLGEEYGRGESAEFVLVAVTQYIHSGRCLKVGLEISSDQQDLLQSAMKGQVPLSGIELKDALDNTAYRAMLSGFSELIKSGKCLSVYALDRPPSAPVTSDAWMEKEAVRIIGDQPVLILTRNMSAVKQYDSGSDEPPRLLAERLRLRTFSVGSVLQYWKPSQCASRNVELITTEDEKSGIYVKEAVGELGARMPEQVSMVSDGVLVWSCKELVVKEEVETLPDNEVVDKISIGVVNEELIVRDEEVIKKIRGGIKHNYPVSGMNREEALEALGEPYEKEKAGDFEQWAYECFDDDGYYYDCYILKFQDGILVKFKDL